MRRGGLMSNYFDHLFCVYCQVPAGRSTDTEIADINHTTRNTRYNVCLNEVSFLYDVSPDIHLVRLES